jgi:phosphoribosylformylglycinamidine synthase
MAAASIDMAVRNAICAGAPLNHLAILDNFCWSSSDSPERLWELKEAARACYDYAVAYGTPYISGKDSMYNDFRGYEKNGKAIHVAALPTLLISAIGVIKDVKKAMTIDAKAVGDLVYVLGNTREEFGGSEYAKFVTGTYAAGTAPKTDAKQNLLLYKALAHAIEKRLVASALGVDQGGLACAVAKMSLAGGLGMNLTLTGDADTMLFSESQGRVLVTVAPAKAKMFEALMKGVASKKLGTVTKEKTIVFNTGKKKQLTLSLAVLARAYKKPYANF